MTISTSLLEAFYNVINERKNVSYRGYNFLFVKRKKQIRLIKGNKLLCIWNIEADLFEDSELVKTSAEENFIKKFKKLPLEVEKMLEKQQESRHKESNSVDQCTVDLYEQLNMLKDYEVNIERVKGIVHSIAGKYVDDWYDIGIHPDKYNDNYPMYFGFALSKVWARMSEYRNERISKLLRKEMIIRPLRAQREGNLVLISDLDHQRFLKLIDEAILYLQEQKERINPFRCMPRLEFEINWWEKERDFFIPFLEEASQKPLSLREIVLKEITAKKKEGPKPSRLMVEISFGKPLKTNPQKYNRQNGIIEWSR